MRKPSIDTRKPIDRLRPADLAAFPIWAFIDEEELQEGRDETWVRPLADQCVPLESYSLSVAARFTSRSGRRFEGIVGVHTANGFATLHAALVTDKAYVFIPWPGMADAPAIAAVAANRLGLVMAELVPLTYQLAVPIQGETALREGVFAYPST